MALAHLNEFPDYYTRLDNMGEETGGENLIKSGSGGIRARC